MSAQVSIEIHFSNFYQDNVIIQPIQMLLDGVWKFDNGGKVSYLSHGNRYLSLNGYKNKDKYVSTSINRHRIFKSIPEL